MSKEHCTRCRSFILFFFYFSFRIICFHLLYSYEYSEIVFNIESIIEAVAISLFITFLVAFVVFHITISIHYDIFFSFFSACESFQTVEQKRINNGKMMYFCLVSINIEKMKTGNSNRRQMKELKNVWS